MLCLLLIGISLNLFKSNTNDGPTILEFDVLSSRDNLFQVFYDVGNGFNEKDSVRINVNAYEKYQKLEAPIPANVRSIRIDVGYLAGENVLLQNIKWKYNKNTHMWNLSDIVRNAKRNPHIGEFSLLNSNELKITTTGQDPFFIIENVDSIEKKLRSGIMFTIDQIIIYALIFIVSILVFLILEINKRQIISKVVSLKYDHVLLIVSFIAIISLPMLAVNLGFVTAQSAEKRGLAQKPTLNLREGNIEDFIIEYEAYVNDNYGYRNKMIRWNNMFKVKVLKVSPVDKVLLGKDGWLYYNSDGVIDDYRGLNHFTDEELQVIKRNLEERRDWLSKQGIRFYIMVAPNKHTIYPEYLPGHIKKINDESRLDQLIKYLNKTSDIDIIDVREILDNNKSDYELYRKNDTHWNALGAYYGYTEIVKAMEKDFPHIKAIQLENFTIQSNDSVGDLGVMLSLGDVLVANRISLSPKFNSAVEDGLAEKELYPNPDQLVVKENKSLSDFNLVMFRDSFATELIPFLSEHFSRSVFIWDQHFNSDVILREQPQVVIHEVVERNLSSLLYTNPLEVRRAN